MCQDKQLEKCQKIVRNSYIKDFQPRFSAIKLDQSFDVFCTKSIGSCYQRRSLKEIWIIFRYILKNLENLELSIYLSFNWGHLKARADRFFTMILDFVIEDFCNSIDHFRSFSRIFSFTNTTQRCYHFLKLTTYDRL